VLVGCLQPDTRIKQDQALTGYWVSKHLEPYSIDPALGGGKTTYGSGYLLKLDSNGQVTSLGADFYWENDSLYQGGEPGMTLKIGDWKKEQQSLILKQRLASKTIMLTSDRFGQPEADTISVLSDSSMIHRQDTLVFVKKPSTDLKQFIKRIVTFHKSKNGS
jgi:hypothetical protein